MNNAAIGPPAPIVSSSARRSAHLLSRPKILGVLAGLLVLIALGGSMLWPLLMHTPSSSSVTQTPSHTPTSSQVTPSPGLTSGTFGQPIDMTRNKVVTITMIEPTGSTECSPDCFSPLNVKVKVGSVITWVNQSPIPHTVTASQGTDPRRLTPAPTVFDSGVTTLIQMHGEIHLDSHDGRLQLQFRSYGDLL